MALYNNWNVSYRTITWFESLLTGHPNILSFDRRDDIVFDIRRRKQDDTISVVIVSDYVFGIASFYKVLSDFRNINAIVLIGNWNKFTAEAREASHQSRRPLFSTKEIYAALFRDEM